MFTDIVLTEEFSEPSGIYREKASLTIRVTLHASRVQAPLKEFCTQWQLGYYRHEFSEFNVTLSGKQSISKVHTDLKTMLDGLNTVMVSDDI